MKKYDIVIAGASTTGAWFAKKMAADGEGATALFETLGQFTYVYAMSGNAIVAAPMIATVTFFTMVQYWNNINNAILYITSNQAVYPLPMYIRNFLNQSPIALAERNQELLSHWDNVKMSYVLFSIIPILLN